MHTLINCQKRNVLSLDKEKYLRLLLVFQLEINIFIGTPQGLGALSSITQLNFRLG